MGALPGTRKREQVGILAEHPQGAARLGVFGGAFNPPHLGHLILAQEACLQLSLEKVVFMPTGNAPHKEIEGGATAKHRLEMCAMATQQDAHFEVSSLETDKSSSSYTDETLAQLSDQRPGVRLVLILGGDQARELASWHSPEVVLERSEVAVVERTGHEREGIMAALAGLAGSERIGFFDMPRIDISSSLIRERLGRSLSVDYLVPQVVADYIRKHGLYV